MVENHGPAAGQLFGLLAFENIFRGIFDVLARVADSLETTTPPDKNETWCTSLRSEPIRWFSRIGGYAIYKLVHAQGQETDRQRQLSGLALECEPASF